MLAMLFFVAAVGLIALSNAGDVQSALFDSFDEMVACCVPIVLGLVVYTLFNKRRQRLGHKSSENP